MRWVNDTRNKLPGDGQVVSRGVAWGLPKTSLLVQPMMPFASRVLGHLPLKMQNNLSGRSISCLYLGPAPGIKGGGFCSITWPLIVPSVAILSRLWVRWIDWVCHMR